MIPGSSKIPFNFKMFELLDVPPAIPGHHILFLTCTNIEDGVGDLVNMKDFGKSIKKIVAGKGYLLYGIAAIMNLGKQYIEQRRAEFEETFDVFKEVRDETNALRAFFSSIQPDINQAACAIIGPHIHGWSIRGYLPTGVQAVEIGEYGQRNLV